MHTGVTGTRVFTNEIDHSSEPSREGSVQVVESHRHTFSVPSSDDEVDSDYEEEEVQIASSVQGDEEEVSAATTPDQPAVGKAYKNTDSEAKGCNPGPAHGETRGLNLKGPSLQDLLTKAATDGTSQEKPIDLEGVCTDVIDVDTESEDDGPDILPLHESSKADQPKLMKAWDKPTAARQTPTVMLSTIATHAEKQTHRDSDVQKYRIVPETPVKVVNDDSTRGHESMKIFAESPAGATDDFDSEDGDALDYDHDFFADEDLERYGVPRIKVSPNSSRPKVAFQAGHEKPHYSTLTPPFDEYRPTRLGLFMSEAIDVSQPAEQPSVWAQQRAPSPSDAALARKASDPKSSSARDIFDKLPGLEWPAATKATYSQFPEHALDNAASREEHSGVFPWPSWTELQNPEPRSYDQGPFSCRHKIAVPAPRSPKPDNAAIQPKKATVTWADPHEENDDAMMNVGVFAETGKQASKITIPSLVENYLDEKPRSSKRRCGGMNKSTNLEAGPNGPEARGTSLLMPHTSGYKRTFEESNSGIPSCSLEPEMWGTNFRSHADTAEYGWQSGEGNSTQRQLGLADGDSPLPDAQPRENIFPTPSASLSQDSVAEPSSSSGPITTPVPGEDTDGPARKKARTSTSSSGGIGKFVMGVGFGLLGAAAAFVATIPASVYEEALREFGNTA